MEKPLESAGFNPLSSQIAQYQTAVNFLLLKFVPLLIYASSDIIGDTKAQIGLGQLHYQGGRGVTVDYKTAYTYFQHAADKSNNPNAQAYLGRMYMEDNSFSKKNYDLAFKYFKDAAHQSNAMGQAGLGQLYLNGYGVKKVKNKVSKYCRLQFHSSVLQFGCFVEANVDYCAILCVRIPIGHVNLYK